MPIIVDEVVISVEITGGDAPPGEGGSASGAREGGGGAGQQAIIEECVERVLEILARREER
ncbi:MAG: DUF5908 family protein [Byssovorax sp.]